MGFLKKLFGESSKSPYPLFDKFLTQIDEKDRENHISSMSSVEFKSEFLAKYTTRSLKNKSTDDLIAEFSQKGKVCLQPLDAESGLVYLRASVQNLNQSEQISDDLSIYCGSVQSRVRTERKQK